MQDPICNEGKKAGLIHRTNDHKKEDEEHQRRPFDILFDELDEVDLFRQYRDCHKDGCTHQCGDADFHVPVTVRQEEKNSKTQYRQPIDQKGGIGYLVFLLEGFDVFFNIGHLGLCVVLAPVNF